MDSRTDGVRGLAVRRETEGGERTTRGGPKTVDSPSVVGEKTAFTSQGY